MSIIDKFMSIYYKEYDYYRELTRFCAELIESKLESNGVRGIVTYRTKRPDRLRLKVESRDAIKNYRNVDQIYQDIVDICGIRIALYFPDESDEVKKILESDFHIVKEKKFPKNENRVSNKRFSGYWATHFRCTLKTENLSSASRYYEGELLEVQVASILMHAWSEVEHDLVYKPLSGEATQEELAILDLLNGLVLTGEIALERLQIALMNRTLQRIQDFSNHYDLANFLYGKFIDEKVNKQKIDNLVLGRVDILFKFLSEIDKNRVCDIEPYLQNQFDINDDRSIVNQLVDYIINNDIELYKKYQNVRADLENKSPFIEKKSKQNSNDSDAILGFLNKWIELEGIMNDYQKIPQDGSNKFILHDRRKSNVNNLLENADVDQLKKYRENLIHGMNKPTKGSIENATFELENIIVKLKTKKKLD